MGATCGAQGEKRNACRFEVRKPGWRRPRGRPGRRWECTIKMHLKEEEWEVAGWIHLDKARDNLWAAVNSALKIFASLSGGISWLDEKMVVSQEELCSVESVACIEWQLIKIFLIILIINGFMSQRLMRSADWRNCPWALTQ
jgi:hypothetical protein